MVLATLYLDGFVIKNHANYAQSNYDIICSAISSIIFGGINWFLNYCTDQILLNHKDQKRPIVVFKFCLNQKTELGFSLIKTQLYSVALSYPKYFLIKEKKIKLNPKQYLQ